ncbi:autotransporter assembly complex protein TamA [Pontibaca methylaminivorans]|uniref:Autotransporter secretion outer membrane protein TamA n=1 Tax=Pontibaca methylaminivorans TaxID=515897 RepID=A0A1R3X014_9RHOB|nr:BamA/TamA family outer membrane protein [Pontibaca methylaminivorans]SIT84128.1 autotransporter secretion outer membrane protein TamA [Pontibaca methylaminivorans]
MTRAPSPTASPRRLILAALLLLPGTAQAAEVSLSAPQAPDDLRDKLEAASAVMSAETNELTSTQELLAAANADYRTMVQVLYDGGYFSPEVRILVDGREAATIPPLNPPARIGTIRIAVDPGPAFRFGRAEVAPLAPDTEMPREFATGEPASTGAIRDATGAAVKGWREIGHAKARPGRQDIVADHPRRTLNAAIGIDQGPKLRFGQMSISGESNVRREAIRRIAGFPEGEVFSPAKIQRVGTRLRQTGAFKSVALDEAEQPNADGTLDFDVAVEDQKPRRISFGAEISSRQGVELSAGWMHRNLWGAAERLRIEGRLRNIGGEEDIDGLFLIRLDQPARLGPDDSLFYILELERQSKPHYTLTRLYGGVGVRRTFSDKLWAEVSLQAGWSRADDVFGERDFKMLTMPVKVQWDRRNDPVSATSGFFLETELTPFLGFSDTASGARLHADARVYYGFGASDRIVLAGRVQMGSVLGASLSETSPDLLFYSGGASTVRGQPYQSLGVPVGTGMAGGRSIVTASAEIRAHVTEKFSVVGFYDVGAVDSGQFIGSGSQHHSGAGLGVRYDLGGLGPLRLDLALPVDGDTGRGLQFYLGIGQAF